MEAASLEITIISADDLLNVRKLGRRMHTYALVSTDHDLCSSQSTRIDRDGGSNPVWNEKLHLSLTSLHTNTIRAFNALNIQIYCNTSFGKKVVGWTKLPFSDIMEGYGAPDALHCLCYRLKTSRGKPQGTVDLSLRFLNSPNSKFPVQLGDYQNISAVSNGTYVPPYHELQQKTAIGVPYSTRMGYPPYGNAHYNLSPTPPSVYPPPHHKQIY